MQSLPDILGGFSLSGEALARLVFFLMATFTAVVSVILFFHWRKYGMGRAIFALTELIYLAVSVALLALAFYAIN